VSDRASADEEKKSGEQKDGQQGLPHQDKLRLPKQLMGIVIGKAGTNIKKIREESETRITAENFEDQCEFTISGSTPEAVEKAKQLIHEVHDKAAAEREQSGSAGGSIGKITDGSADDKPPLSGANASEVASERREHPAESLRDKDRLPDRALDRPEASDTMRIPQPSIGRIIGKGGETIKKLQKDTGAKIDVKTQEDPCIVQISGSRHQVGQARRKITSILDRASNFDRRSGGGGGGHGGPQHYGHDPFLNSQYPGGYGLYGYPPSSPYVSTLGGQGGYCIGGGCNGYAALPPPPTGDGKAERKQAAIDLDDL
jgi:polyribonucleotide nucleotidyltransferase